MTRPTDPVVRALAAVQLLGLGTVAWAVVSPLDAPPTPGGWADATIYPWWTMLLVLAGVLVAIATLVAGTRAPLGLVGGVGVVAAELAGHGFVALEHWQPAFGMGGGYAGDVPELRRLALVVGVAGVVAALAALAQLVLTGLLPAAHDRPLRVRRVAVVVGLLLVVVLPVGLGLASGGGEDLDVTSLGAAALAFSAPWGLAVAGSAWLAKPAADVVLRTCAGCAVLAVIGPHLAADDSARTGFVITAVVLGSLTASTARAEETAAGLSR